jgi:NADPH-dependent 2,4-dienoyl-CoA reductase/sulfur reductase-like enzyme
MSAPALTRRAALGLGLALAAPRLARAAARPRVAVLGGGAGGATCARYLARDGALDVTLVEADPVYATCFFSNLVLGGLRAPESLRHGYDRLAAQGVRVVTARAEAVDRDGRALALGDGARVPYDRLVLAPGIDILWESVPGFSEAAAARMPVAWRGGAEAAALRDRLDALEDGATVVMVAPPNPYRCPPGPYERVSMMAHRLASTGRGGCRIIVLDQKDRFSKQGLFLDGWARRYPGMVEWYPPDVHGGIVGVEPDAGAVETGLDRFEGALVNVIPAQAAGGVARAAGLADDSGFCPVEAETMRSARDPSIWVLGDAAIAGDMPKSAFAANSQAKVAAAAIRAELLGARAFPARYANTCWSLLAPEDGVKIGAVFAPAEGRIAAQTSFVSAVDDDAARRRANVREAAGWYEAIIADAFG